MDTVSINHRGQWSTRMAFILAAVGSAIGLGNIWKFPYIVGMYGGGAFILVYLVFILIIGMPVMMTEIMLGRRGRQNPVGTMQTLAMQAGQSAAWRYVGWFGMVAGFLILSYYSVVAGEVMAYVFRAGSGAFDNQTADGIRAILTDFVSEPEKLLAWHTIFMVLTTVVVARGVRLGLERTVRWLMPALFILLVILVGYAMSLKGFGQAVNFLFEPDFDKLFYLQDAHGKFVLDEAGQRVFTWTPVMVAMGHSFFTLSLGMGAIMVYGSYLGREASISRVTLAIVAADTLVAILAGLAIFPLVFTADLAPAQGPDLIFLTLPLAFGTMPGGSLFGMLFFLLLLFAAWSSAISLMEPAVAWLSENRSKRFDRAAAASWIGVIIWLLGIISVFATSGTTLRDVFESVAGWFGIEDARFTGKFFSLNLFNIIDFATANIMLPLGGLAMIIFAAWVMRRESIQAELAAERTFVLTLWRILIRYVTPLAIVFVFLYRLVPHPSSA
ncbi:MAG TPA: sodium-dependent transporter [Gammaproteobacteria bacterium]|nr:sodium-dependent transporter [Gammaproteobacteria bacterium]